MFVYHFETDTTYTFSFNHPDVLNININVLQSIVNIPCKKFIFDKKNAKHFVDLKNFIDIKFDNYAKTLEQIDIKLPSTHDIRSCPIMIIKKSFNDTLKLLKNIIGDVDKEHYFFENDFFISFKQNFYENTSRFS